jgi:hypothetical protein
VFPSFNAGLAMKLPPAPVDLGLFGAETALTTPIASELQAHFERGGSPAEAVRLVAMLERAGARAITAKPRTEETTGRGSRLAADWQPSHSEAAFALDRGMPQARVSTEAEKFRNYWTAKSGTGATKLDWSATWRNWIITAMERGYGPSSYQGHRPGTNPTPRRASTGSDAILTGMARLARRIDERRMPADAGGRQVSHGANATGELDLGPSRAR